MVRFHEDPPEPGIPGGVDHFRFADRRQDALGRAGIHHRVVPAAFQIVRQGHFRFAPRLVIAGEGGEEVVARIHASASIKRHIPQLTC